VIYVAVSGRKTGENLATLPVLGGV